MWVLLMLPRFGGAIMQPALPQPSWSRVRHHQAQLGRFPAQTPVRRDPIPEGLSLHRSYAAVVM